MSTEIHSAIHDLKHSSCYRKNGKIIIEIDEDDVIDVGANPFMGSCGGGPAGMTLKVTDRETFLNTVAHNLAVHCRETDAGCETWTRIAVKKAGEAAAESDCGAVDVSDDDTQPGSTALEHEPGFTFELPGIFDRPPGG